MHPEFLREMADLRGREMRARASQARLARLARFVGRRRQDLSDPAAETGRVVIPAIPDYVDGSFRAEPAAAGTAAAEPTVTEPTVTEPTVTEPTVTGAAGTEAGHSSARRAA